MINKIKTKSEFTKNVLTLMTGTTIAQALPIAISPILTRIYTPEDFGVFALYVSITTIIGVIATGRYELAILLPKKESEAINVFVISIIITFSISVFSLLIASFFSVQVTEFTGNENIKQWLYLAPISILLLGVYQSLNFWGNRKKKYKKLSISRAAQSTVIVTLNLVMGFFDFNHSGLIVSQIVGQVFCIALLGSFLFNDRYLLKAVNKEILVALAKKFVNFPKFDVIASLANTSSLQIGNILFNTIYNSATAGFYFFTQRMLGLPVSLIANSISEVFRERAAQDYKENGNAKDIYIKTFKKLFILSFFPSLILLFFSRNIFVFVFGNEWEVAGMYAQLLTPMLFLRFISSPLSFLFFIGGKQLWNLFLQSSLLIMVSLSFYFGITDRNVVIYISFSFSVFYISQLFYSYLIATKNYRENIDNFGS